jgi:histidinol-phosphate aminotransferase
MIFNSSLDNIKIYEAGKPIELVVREYGVDSKDIVKLASNENPNGSSPLVKEAVSSIIDNMALYPDDSMYELKDALAKKYSVDSHNIVIGAGSDQVIDFCVKAKCNKDSKILMAKTTFAMYEIYARQVEATIIKTESDTHNLEQFYELYQKENPDLIFLCLPNNPLGECLDRDDVYNFLDKIDKDTLVVVDGAYMEYASYKDNNKLITPKELINKYSNCVYLGTFSKAYGLGGMRVGYGVAQKEIIEAFHKLRPPFNITTLSLKAAIIALKDEEFVKSSIIENFDEMKRYEEFCNSKGFDYIDSYTNFITIKLDKSSKDISFELLKRGMIIRDLIGYGLNAIRVTIGKKSQNSRFFELFDEVYSLV